MSRKIILTQGKVAIVDEEDFDYLNKFNWYAERVPRKNREVWYAKTNARLDGVRKKVRMHQLILDAPRNVSRDHVDGDGLNNRRGNIRLCTVQQNAQNMGKRTGCTSSFKGVYFHKATGKWMARIKANYKHRYLGVFDDEIDAARAYDQAAVVMFGEFARVNL